MLTVEKMTQMVSMCRNTQQKQSLSVRELARLIGKIAATLPAIYQAPLWYWESQRLKNQTMLQSQSFDQIVVLNQEAQLELEWWCTRMRLVNGKSLLAQEPDLIVEADASMQAGELFARTSKQGDHGPKQSGNIT